jgi:hypothetical protein
MRTTRSLLAAAATTVAIVATATGVAGAGQSPLIIDSDTVCDTETGNFVITVSMENDFIEDGDLEVNFEAFEGDTETDSGELPVSPNPVPSGGTATSTLEVAGTTTFVDFLIFVDYGDGPITNTIGVELGSPCEATPTTPTTGESTTTSSAVATEAVRPTFTG